MLSENEKYFKIFLSFVVFISILYIGYPVLTQTQDFQFHLNNPKGICIYNDKDYCKNYHFIGNVFYFENEIDQYLFWGIIFFIIFPFFVTNNLKEILLYFGLGFSYNIFRSGVFLQGLGLIFIYFWYKKNLSFIQKFILLIFSIFVHKFLCLFLVFLWSWEITDDYFSKTNRTFREPIKNR